jgi:hypothetical protein
MSVSREMILARIREANSGRAAGDNAGPDADHGGGDGDGAAAAVAADYAALPRLYRLAHHDAADQDIAALFAERAAEYSATVQRSAPGDLPGAVAAVLKRRAGAVAGPDWRAGAGRGEPPASDEPPNGQKRAVPARGPGGTEPRATAQVANRKKTRAARRAASRAKHNRGQASGGPGNREQGGGGPGNREQGGGGQGGRGQGARGQGGRGPAGREQGGRGPAGREQGGRGPAGREQGGRGAAGREAPAGPRLPAGPWFAAPADLPADWLGELPGPATVADEPALPVADLDGAAGVITGCAVAIAETGTIVLDHGPAQGRRVLSLVPDFHLVVVREDQIEPDLAGALERLDPRRPHTFISGPSATSDIELIRVEGVHGPRNLHILIAG